MSTNDVVLDTLTEKVHRQDRFIAELQAELQLARQASVETMLGQLRLREAVLLYVGQDADNFTIEQRTGYTMHQSRLSLDEMIAKGEKALAR